MQTAQEMKSIQSSVERTDNETELQAVMGRIKNDVRVRQGTESEWTPAQAQDARNWCRSQREFLDGQDKVTGEACQGWEAPKSRYKGADSGKVNS